MKKYCLLQGKRLSRVLPGALLAALVLLGGLLAVFSATVRQDGASAQKQKFQVALTGCTDDPLLQAGLVAVSGFDSSRFSLEVQQMDRDAAQKALRRGQIAAYVEIPEEFMDQAMMGNILPLKFVTTTGSPAMTTLVKDELTQVISQVLLSAQKGVYGMEQAVRDNGLSLDGNLDVMALRYTEYVLARDRLYSLEEVGIGDSLPLEGYLLCGLSVLLVMLCCLPFAPKLIRSDLSLQRLLAAKGLSPAKQTLAEYSCFAFTIYIIVWAVLLGAELYLGPDFPFGRAVLSALPVTLMAAAFSYMLCNMATDLIGGILLQFFSILSVCFLSGCLYPAYFFPAAVQKVAAWLPAGLARSLLSGVITGDAGLAPACWLLVYTLAFLSVSGLVNCLRVKGVDR